MDYSNQTQVKTQVLCSLFKHIVRNCLAIKVGDLIGESVRAQESVVIDLGFPHLNTGQCTACRCEKYL